RSAAGRWRDGPANGSRSLVVSGIVDEQHVPLGSHDVAQELAVVAVAGEVIRNLHPRLDPGEAQDFRGMIERVALQVVAAPSLMLDGGLVDVGGPGVGAREPEKAEQGET